jgi:hypothetical protein
LRRSGRRTEQRGSSNAAGQNLRHRQHGHFSCFLSSPTKRTTMHFAAYRYGSAPLLN